MFQNVYMNLLSPPQIAIWDQETSRYSEVVLRITIPVRGRKRSAKQGNAAANGAGIKNHNPRKGTETTNKVVVICENWQGLRITIPVRGRKLIVFLIVENHLSKH